MVVLVDFVVVVVVAGFMVVVVVVVIVVVLVAVVVVVVVVVVVLVVVVRVKVLVTVVVVVMVVLVVVVVFFLVVCRCRGCRCRGYRCRGYRCRCGCRIQVTVHCSAVLHQDTFRAGTGFHRQRSIVVRVANQRVVGHCPTVDAQEWGTAKKQALISQGSVEMRQEVARQGDNGIIVQLAKQK